MSSSGECAENSAIHLDCEFPGGNIVVDEIKPDGYRLRQDWSSSRTWWFYWAFRVRGAAGRTLHFQFDDRDVFTSGGPCCSADGKTWKWLGETAVRDNGFSYSFDPDENEVFLALCPLYTHCHLQDFLDRHTQIAVHELGMTEGGRSLISLHVPSEKSLKSAIFTARTHACEATASYALEGILDFWLSEESEARWLRQNVDLHAVPFVDADGVEEGEQGKNRSPHDHNRDWTSAPRYAATFFIQHQVPRWCRNDTAFMDLHSPWFKGDRNEDVFLIGQPPAFQAPLDVFSRHLVEQQRGPLRYNPANDIAFGSEWNVETLSINRYFQQNPSVKLACTVETPYATAAGTQVLPESARLLGHDLARALAHFLQG